MKTIRAASTIPESIHSRIQSLIPVPEPHVQPLHKIPVCEPDISQRERSEVMRAVNSSWISGAGPYIERFEQAFAQSVSHTKYAVAVNSGTSALHLSLVACNIGPGDEVILPTFTMIACINAIRYCGATPILVDADPITWNMDVSQIERKITKRTKAIMPVHIYGLSVDMKPLLALAKTHDLWVIEDAAESHGATYKGKTTGSLGHIAAYSLFANKIVATGEGGMVTTNNKKLADLVRLLRGHAFTPKHHFWHAYVGYSYEMTNLSAAVGYAQVTRFDALLAKRRSHGALYTKYLSQIPGLQLPVEPAGYTNTYWMYGVVVDEQIFGMSRDTLRAFLAREGIETRSFFVPMHIQPSYALLYADQRFPVAEMLGSRGFYLPSSSKLTTADIRRICASVRRAYDSVHRDTVSGEKKNNSISHARRRP